MDAIREQAPKTIAGYDLGADKVVKSPITLKDWKWMKKSALISEEGVVYLTDVGGHTF